MIKIKIMGGDTTIKDEDEYVIDEMDKDGNENPNERKARLFPGFDDMRRLSLGIAEDKKDFSNCKQIELDKKYKKNKDTLETEVEIDQKLDCQYTPQKPISKKQVERWKKLSAIQKKYEDQPQVKIAKSVFDRFMDWMDANPVNETPIN